MKYLQIFVLLASCPAAFSQINVLTANYDNNRTNSNMGETLLNPSNVNATQFGKLYSFPVDGEVYAQPLYVHGLNMPNIGTRNVLFVATMHNSVYAFDADAIGGTSPLWKMTFGAPVDPLTYFTGYTDVLTEVGILSTPVIDPNTKTIYVVHFTSANNSNAFYLHALDLLTGAEKFNGPVQVQASVAGSGSDSANGVLTLNPAQHIQRTGLLLANGSVYLGFGSHADQFPYHGWLLGYDASNLLHQTLVYNATANNAAGAAIWQSGRGIAADASGIYFATGNGTYNEQSGAMGESVVRLTPAGALADWFTPGKWAELNDGDLDFGANGPILVPNSNLIIAGGKTGAVCLLDRTNLGHSVTADSQIVQSFQSTDAGTTSIFNAAFWPLPTGPYFYIWALGEPLRAFQMASGKFVTTAAAINNKAQNAKAYSGYTVTSNDTIASTGILWATTVKSDPLPASGTLRAFSATNVATELWNSDMNASRDALGNFVKFANPTVANGKVFVGTQSGQVQVYGLLPNTPGIASVVDAASFRSSTVAPGELITIFGNSIGPASAQLAAPDQATGAFPTKLGELTVSFGSTAAPLIYADSGQINTVVPFSAAGQSTISMTVSTPAGQTFSVNLPVSPAVPSFFQVGGTSQGAILNNADLSPNSASNAAARGSVVAIFVTGTGVTTPDSDDGIVASASALASVAQPVTVTVGGQAAQVLYQGSAPGLIAGVTQLNVQIPNGIQPGPSVPVTMSVGAIASRNTATLAVK